MKLTVPIYFNATKKKTVMVALNWYRNAHYQTLNKAKRHYKDLISLQVYEQRLKPLEGKFNVHYDIYLKRKGSDGGNVRSVIEKFVLDALVDNNIIKDDNFEIVIGDSANYYHDKDNPRAEINIIKL